MRGYQPRRFSFNKPGGRCEACEGNGQKKIEMHFLPDVWVECDACHGSRYNPETLAVHYKGQSIADVLEMRVGEALELFANIPKIRRMLQTLADVGLDYLSLGQAAPTLSGGEAQRVKLAAELARPNTGRTLYILDEPTTGLHFDDVHKLLDVLNRLVDLGNTVIVIEHNLDVIKTADWVIDLGPEAGDGAAARVVGRQGTPEGRRRPATGAVATPAQALAAGCWQPARTPSGRNTTRTPPSGHREGRRRAGSGRQGRPACRGRPTAGAGTPSSASRHKGKPCRWEGDILDWIDERIHEFGDFGDTNWNQPQRRRDRRPREEPGLVLPRHDRAWRWLRAAGLPRRPQHLQAGGRCVSRLGIRPLNETAGLEVYGNEERVRVTNHKGPWQSVTILVHRLSEIDTPAFREFLAEAVDGLPAEPATPADQAGRRDAVEGQRRALAPGRQGLPARQEGRMGPGRCCPGCWTWCARWSRTSRCAGTAATPSRCACPA